MRQQIICNHDYRRLDCLHMNICVEVILLNKWLANTVQEKTFKTLVPLNTGPCLSRWLYFKDLALTVSPQKFWCAHTRRRDRKAQVRVSDFSHKNPKNSKNATYSFPLVSYDFCYEQAKIFPSLEELNYRSNPKKPWTELDRKDLPRRRWLQNWNWINITRCRT